MSGDNFLDSVNTNMRVFTSKTAGMLSRVQPQTAAAIQAVGDRQALTLNQAAYVPEPKTKAETPSWVWALGAVTALSAAAMFYQQYRR